MAALGGLESSLATLAVSGGSVFLANRFSPHFRSSLGISGKVALALSPALGVFFLKSELILADAKRNPAAYDLPDADGNRKRHAQPETLIGRNIVSANKLGLHHRAANYAYDHPYYLLAATGLPIVGGFFYSQAGRKEFSILYVINLQHSLLFRPTLHTDDHLKLSQKIMHTRVWGQGSILVMLTAIMCFRDYMERNGRFQIDEERDTELEYRKRGVEWEARELIREANAIYER